MLILIDAEQKSGTREIVGMLWLGPLFTRKLTVR